MRKCTSTFWDGVPAALGIMCLAAWAATGAAGDSLEVGPSALKAEPAAMLALGVVVGADSRVVVHATLMRNGTQPSLILFGITFDPAQLAFENDTVTTGPAAAAAGKYVDAYAGAQGEIRLIVWGLNNAVVEDGELLSLEFSRLSVDSQQGLFLEVFDASVATPEGGSVPVRTVYFAAPRVVASQGQADGIRVEWDAVPGALEYQVFRSESDDPGTAEPVSGWIPASELSYLDVSVIASELQGAGCLLVAPTRLYYYWVRARQGETREGTLNAVAAEGYLLSPFAAPSAANVAPGVSGDAVTLLVAAASLGLVCGSRRRQRALR